VAILDHIRKGIAEGDNDGLREVLESYNSRREEYDEPIDSEKDKESDIANAFYVAAQREPFSLKSAPEVRYRMTTIVDEARTGQNSNVNESALTTHQLVIESTTMDIRQLQIFVDEVHAEHVTQLQNKCHERLHVFVYEGVDSQFNLVFKTYPFDTTCSLDTMFFDKKEELLRQMNFFVGNRKWYEEKGKPWTFGVCTYGEPGCGKTTFEKAACKHLNRHMIVVDISRIQSQQEADRLFFSREIAGRNVPYDKRVYVFPDIDRQTDLLYAEEYKSKGSKPIIPNPLSGSTASKEVKELADLLRKKDTFAREPIASAAGKTPMNLSKLLNILDGVPERTGQIIIMSANHPERLDDAITRPGRIDTIIRFGKASSMSSKRIIETFFDLPDGFWDDMPGHEEKMDKKKTPAEIFQICSQEDSAISAVKRISQTSGRAG
jgi:ATP-dependent 26S proteasome regulatory subunit